MSRVPKFISRELIPYAKSVNVQAQFWGKESKVAFEFFRQMSSKNLAKLNPSFVCKIDVDDKYQQPVVRAEFADGNKWEMVVTGMTIQQIRSKFYDSCSAAEDAAEQDLSEYIEDLESGKIKADAKDSKSAPAKPAGKAGGGKPAGKK